ncbi:MAG TPA: hypothetical protein VF411_00680 [Bacteroidia bacterium]
MRFILCCLLTVLFVAARGQNRDIMGNPIIEEHKLTPIYKKYYKQPAHLDVLYESEVTMAKRQWNYIDLTDPLNKKLLNTLSIKDIIYPLIEVLEFGIITQKIKCFKNENFGSQNNKTYSVAEFKKLITTTDTVIERSLNENTNNDTLVTVIKTTTLNRETIKGFLLKEEWYFNKKKAKDEIRIIGIAPLIYSEKDQKLVQVYWVYYKECRELLASFKTTNPIGTDEVYTYTDLFDKHIFTTKAVKQSNIFDRNQPENSKGTDVEIENDKNKQNLHNSTNDLFPK